MMDASQPITAADGTPLKKKLAQARFRSKLRAPGLVGDGRALGTIVFPDDDLKIFLDASVEVRAERRYLELIQSSQTVERSAILRDLEIRDVRDRTRKVAPLVPATDAYMIDSSDKTAAQVAADVRGAQG